MGELQELVHPLEPWPRSRDSPLLGVSLFVSYPQFRKKWTLSVFELASLSQEFKSTIIVMMTFIKKHLLRFS